jgi:hypothetical protein
MHHNSINRLYADNDQNTYNPQLPEFPEQASEFTYIFCARLTEAVYASGTVVYPAIPVAYKWNRVHASNPDVTNNAAVPPYILKWLETGESDAGHAVAYPCQKQLDLRNMIENITSSVVPITKVVYIKAHATESGMHYVIFDPANTREFWALITGSTSLTNGISPEIGIGIGSRTQWEYDFVEAGKVRTKYTQPGGLGGGGFSRWEALVGGRSGKAYNSIEDINYAAANRFFNATQTGGPTEYTTQVGTTLGTGDKLMQTWTPWTDTFTDSRGRSTSREAGNRIMQTLTVVPVIAITDGNLNTINVAGPDAQTGGGARNAHNDTQTPVQSWLYGDLTSRAVVTADVEFGRMHPCPNYVPVRMIEVTFQDKNWVGNGVHPVTTEYWFCYENSIEMSINPRLDICVDITPSPVEWCGARIP